MENRDQIKALLKRYVRGQCSAAEEEQVFECLKRPEGIVRLKEVLDETSEGLFDKRPEMDPAVSREILARLQRNIQKEPERTAVSVRGNSLRAGSRAVRKIAAVLAGFILLSAAVYLVVNRYGTVTYTTGYAEQEVIVLPDHSIVTLNSKSRLSFSRNWSGKQTRDVQLDGEAFFEVAKNAGKPFIVTTSGVRVRVLGTTFNVKSYEDDETIETTLVEGKVMVQQVDKQSGGDSIVLKPNQKAIYSRNSSDIVLAEVKPEIYTSWKDGMLVFEDESFAGIVRALERWYGVKFDIEDEMSKQCRFTIKIKNESLAEVLKLFSSTTSAEFSINGESVSVRGELCN